MTKPLQSLKKALLLAFLSTLIACSPPTVVEINDNTYYQLEEQVEAVKNSQVADAAPLEMKFITEKLQRAKKAKAKK